ncbi:NUDIX domain-containing protein [Oerskovia sp. Root22]|uniref:NUDIX hydrolase n=1 Tax=Oerskovia sp. Root22 TaxID=1736494 RepID=UPI0006F5208D|nr:NUDIX domain-containing protein [Oerskovia sp. Root22]KRC32958.1 NUDIX hydrolase [Oerskovia sp. Root22]
MSPRETPASPASATPPSAARIPVTVDVVALTVRDGTLQVLLVTRLLDPFRDRLALPGGFVLAGETLPQAAARELAEETGVAVPGHLEQLRTYGPLDRDPRGPVLSVAHLLLAPTYGLPAAGSDAAQVGWYPVDEALADGAGLAFDHHRILRDGVERARAKLEYSTLATAFCGPEFTIAQLRAVYEAVWGTRLDPRNFHRKAVGTPGFLVETGESTSGGTGRPAALYRLAPEAERAAGARDVVGKDEAPASVPAVLNPPLMRPAG